VAVRHRALPTRYCKPRGRHDADGDRSGDGVLSSFCQTWDVKNLFVMDGFERTAGEPNHVFLASLGTARFLLISGGLEGGMVNERRLVSVIMPAFNAAAHLAKTIDSCLAQSYINFELLLVDDGSTDDTAELATRFAAADPRIRIFRIPNSGIAAARNVAIAQARGEFFALLDSDDVWMPDYLERQLGTLARHPSADVITANAINLGGQLDGQAYWSPSEEMRPISLLEMIAREDAIHIFSVFRRTVIDRVGGFDPSLTRNEDYHFWLRAAAANCQFLADFTPRGYYRRRPDSSSADERRMLAGIVGVLNDIRRRCSIDGPALQVLDAQVRRFTRRLQMAEARECLAAGDSTGAMEFLRRIPSADRGLGLSVMLTVARLFPSLLSHSYRTKRAVREVRARLARRH
jgi:glycosyltransferase involved in cell wall biosynthesis